MEGKDAPAINIAANPTICVCCRHPGIAPQRTV
jgi:hypothetical protein